MPLLKHPKIYIDTNGQTTTAILWDDGGVVLATGQDALKAHHDSVVIEPNSACVFPALTDAHIHLWGLGLRTGAISFRDVTSTHQLYDLLRAYNLGDSPSGWVLGTDWDQHLWADSDALMLEVLDEIWPDTPMSLRRVDGHALWVNSMAMRRAGISQSYDPGPGGDVGRYNGKLNGLLIDDAMNPVLRVTPEAGEAEDRATFLATARRLHRHGVVGAHKAWMPTDRLPMLRSLRDTGKLPLRLHLLFDVHDDNIDALRAQGPIHDNTAWLNECGIKFFADGALGSQGAALLEPYPSGKMGVVVDSAGFMGGIVPSLVNEGWQVATHAIGDAAARDVLTAYNKADRERLLETRPRLEHAQMMTDDDVARMAELGVIASIQAIHMHSDAAWADDVLTPAQLNRLFRWRDLLDHTKMCGGSDFPIEDLNPWHAIATSITRLDRRQRAFNPEQALTVREALHTYTTGAAYAAFWENKLGQLDVGFCADFIALDRDPLNVTPQEIWDTQVQQCWLAGEPQI